MLFAFPQNQLSHFGATEASRPKSAGLDGLRPKSAGFSGNRQLLSSVNRASVPSEPKTELMVSAQTSPVADDPSVADKSDDAFPPEPPALAPVVVETAAGPCSLHSLYAYSSIIASNASRPACLTRDVLSKLCARCILRR